ncbi:MAG: DNA cytosine methyltransferase [Deltaproteobacteria bacterium]|nr:DNA cytosine methyltransferase [Deltaproteobacteria bacterium]
MYAAEAFTGGGLLSLGLTIEGIHVGEVCELNKAAVRTLRYNYGHKATECDARKWTPKKPKGGIDLLCGGPPCQPWSGAGKKKGYRDERDMFPEIIRWTKATRPRVVVMENVGSTPAARKRAHAGLSPGILAPKFAGYLEWWWSEMRKIGYEGVVWSVLSADYGTPQLRARVLFVAWPKGAPQGALLREPPPPTHAAPEDAARLGLMAWTSGFERLAGGCCGRFGYFSCAYLWNLNGMCETCYQGANYEMAEGEQIDAELSREALEYVMRDPERIRKHRPADISGSFDRHLAPTMVADLARGVPYGLVVESGGFVRDFTDKKDYDFLRRLTTREAAKLMDVPQWYVFQGTVGQQYKQIGNGVPVNLGRAIARHVISALGEEPQDPYHEHEGLWPFMQGDTCHFTRSMLEALRPQDEPGWKCLQERNPPKGWTDKPAPTADTMCYRTKTDALNKFLDYNWRIVEEVFRGPNFDHGYEGFDNISDYQALKGKRRVNTLAKAVWFALPGPKPWCLDNINLDLLNDSDIAQRAGARFSLPSFAEEQKMIEQEEEYWKEQGEEACEWKCDCPPAEYPVEDEVPF